MTDQYSVGVSAISLTGGAAKTILEVQGVAAKNGSLKYWAVSFNDVVSNVPVLVEVLRATGGITGTTIVPALVGTGYPAAQSVVKHTSSGEGTPATVPLESYYVTPNGGLFAIQYPLDDELAYTSTSFVRIRCTAPSNETVSVVARIRE